MPAQGRTTYKMRRNISCSTRRAQACLKAISRWQQNDTTNSQKIQSPAASSQPTIPTFREARPLQAYQSPANQPVRRASDLAHPTARASPTPRHSRTQLLHTTLPHLPYPSTHPSASRRRQGRDRRDGRLAKPISSSSS